MRRRGAAQMWGAQFIGSTTRGCGFPPAGSGRWVRPPSAIGAQIANPGKRVFALVGDGGFQMSIPELATIANYDLPVKIVVMTTGTSAWCGSGRSCSTTTPLRRVPHLLPRPRKARRCLRVPGRTVEDPKR